MADAFAGSRRGFTASVRASALGAGGAVHLLLIEAAALGDDFSVSQILNEKLLTVEEASKPDTRLYSTAFGLTALHRAKTPEVARILLDFGVPINCRGPLGQTPLHTCCDNPPVLKLLLERGADLTAATNDGSTALEWAVFADCVDSVKLLLEKGANVQSTNKNGNTPLHMVSSRKMTELLLAFGAKVSAENNEGKIPLETAAERKGEPDFAAITELLLDISEERGLRYRSKKVSSGARLQHSTDSFGEQSDAKSKVRKRWSLVRERFLTHKGSVKSMTRGRAGSTKEWHGDDTAGSFYGGDLDSLRSARGDSGITVEASNLEEATENGEDEERIDKDEHSNFYTRFFELAIIERPFLAKKMLDRHRTFLYAKGTAKYYQYDFSLLGGVDSVSNALRLIVEYDQRELVAHDVVQWLVTAKWGLFAQQYVILEACIYFVFIFLFVLSTLRAEFPAWVTKSQPVIDVLLFVLSMRYLFRLFMEWHQRGGMTNKRVAMSIFKADKFTGPVFVIVNLLLFLRYFVAVAENSLLEIVLETVGCVMLWVRILYFAEAQFQSVGLTMSIVRRMIADITVYVLVQLVFLIGFAHAMTIAFRGKEEPDKNFGTPMASFATLGFFIFNLDADAVFDEPDASRRTLAMILLAIYESLVVVVFLNLVIAVMTTSFEDVMSNARSEWLLVRAKICVRMEDQTSAGPCTTRVQRHLRRLKAKRTAIVMERASGENEVSLPISYMPPPLRCSLVIKDFIRRTWRWIQRLCTKTRSSSIIRSQKDDEDEEEEVDTTRRFASYGTLESPASPASNQSRLQKHGSGSFGRGGGEVFTVGTFTRFSVLNAPSSGGAASPSLSRTASSFETGAPEPSSSPIGRDASIRSDEELIRSLKLILQELERRQQDKMSS